MSDPGPPSLTARIVTWTLALLTLGTALVVLSAVAWMALWVGVSSWAVALLVLAALGGLGVALRQVRRSALGPE